MLKRFSGARSFTSILCCRSMQLLAAYRPLWFQGQEWCEPYAWADKISGGRRDSGQGGSRSLLKVVNDSSTRELELCLCDQSFAAKHQHRIDSPF